MIQGNCVPRTKEAVDNVADCVLQYASSQHQPDTSDWVYQHWNIHYGDWSHSVLGGARRRRPTLKVDHSVSNGAVSRGRTVPADSERRQKRHPLGADDVAVVETHRRNGVSAGDSVVGLALTLSVGRPHRSRSNVSPNQLDGDEKKKQNNNIR
ncbi:Uncharacterized protein APZ42_016941 [Daphnia magna]|uniref:Uncharacterized protein n=1 Tax=Daphnia magna TaxID=35525 RepID=A0A165A8S5_9CRUS|nr:Uncharacterized protein APZ42_016941 [Daphnia magna]